MIVVTFGHSGLGEVEELIIEADSVQISYALLRDSNDNAIALFDCGLWRRLDTGTLWTDVSIQARP